jgi:cellulose synthase operon protein C
MLKVGCPSCQAPYELDERRLPASGLKMRCPKCGATFHVKPDGAIQGAAVPDADVDLPALKAPRRPDLPAPVPRAPAPAAAPAAPPAEQRRLATPFDAWQDDADLPAVKAPKPPAPPRAPASPLDDLDLPAPVAGKKSAPWEDELDLPAPKGARTAPAMADELDLPMPKAPHPGALTDLDLPGAVDLPAPKTAGEGLGELDLPVAKGEGDLPAPTMDRVDLPARSGQQDLPVRRRGAPSFEELDLGSPEGGTADELPGLDLDAPDLGEIDLPVGGELEFDALPEEEASAHRPGARAPAAGRTSAVAEPAPQRPSTRPPPKAKVVRVALVTTAVLALLVGAGAALSLTPHGFFGVYFFERFHPSAGDSPQVSAAIEQARQAAGLDTLDEARRGLRALAGARREAGLHRGLLAESLFFEALLQARFGAAPDGASRAAAIHARLEQRGFDAPSADRARAAHALATGNPAEAAALLAGAPAEGDGWAHVLAGEIALAQGQATQAAAAFGRAVQPGMGARAQAGVARAHAAAANLEQAAAAAEKALEQSPRHAAARVILARHALATGRVDEARQLAAEAAGTAPVEGQRLRAERPVQADAWGLLGHIHGAANERGRARAAYERALAADSLHVTSLVGLGQVLIRERQPREALTRFERALELLEAGGAAAVMGARPLEVTAAIGAVQALLDLDAVQDARARMAELERGRPEDPEVLLWVGKTAEAAGDFAQAKARYEHLMRQAPDSFDGYLALAQLHFAQGRPSDAAAALQAARDNVPETAQMRRLMGEIELARDSLDAAIREFRRALELEPGDASSLFGVGLAHRRAGRLERAEEVFEQVAERDPTYPGLAVERGRIHEARGRAAKAVASYRVALEQRPQDPDLLLRLGAALVALGDVEEAQKAVGEAMRERPQSAEGEYLLGRVALVRGQLQQAVAHLERAAGLDASRGDFHLYLARTRLEQGALAKAFESVATALERDPGLADAYWIRGRLRLRSGAVRDALDDLKKALELAPGRHEALADMGESYDQLGKRREATAAYQKALEGDNTRGDWWYRLGRLQYDAGQQGPAATALARATVLGDAQDPRPGWLMDAHRLHADALRAQGKRGEAIHHYRRFLELAPADAIDRRDVQRKLMDLGAAP